jgi:hypothetical protein
VVRGDLFVTAFAAACVADGEERTAAQSAVAAEIPTMIRRRLRGAALAAVCCGLESLHAATKPVEVIFCSRHGDLDRTRRLLLAMAEGRALSPLEFSLSVHNALAGMLDLVRQERTGHTTIAAGRDTFAAALIEASARLWGDRDHATLLLYVEEPVPEELQSHTDRSFGGTVLAALLEQPRTAARPLAVFRRVPAAGAIAQESEAEARSVLSVLEGGRPVRLASRAGFEWVVEATT